MPEQAVSFPEMLQPFTSNLVALKADVLEKVIGQLQQPHQPAALSDAVEPLGGKCEGPLGQVSQIAMRSIHACHCHLHSPIHHPFSQSCKVKMDDDGQRDKRVIGRIYVSKLHSFPRELPAVTDKCG